MGLGTTVYRRPTRHDLWNHVTILLAINYKKLKLTGGVNSPWIRDPPASAVMLCDNNIRRNVIKNFLLKYRLTEQSVLIETGGHTLAIEV
jgi:hypothetical protein